MWLLDSAGARIQEAVGSLFAGSGHLFRGEVVISGVIPQVAALMGPCAAGAAVAQGLADFVPMVKGHGSMALASPHLVRAAVGEDVTQEELGGSRVHCRKSGVGDLEVADNQECIARIKQNPPSSPSHCEEGAAETGTDRPRRAASHQSSFLRPARVRTRKPTRPAPTTSSAASSTMASGSTSSRSSRRRSSPALARMGGRPVGIVANQPRQLGGVLDDDWPTRRRGRHLCNAFGIPLAFLMDVPGFMVGTKVEAGRHHPPRREDALRGRQRDGAEGHGRAAQGLRRGLLRDERAGAYEPDLIVAWPSAEISVMGAEGAVEIVFRKQVEEV